MTTMINRLEVTGDQQEFEKALSAVMEYMSRQPGYLGHRLHRSLSNPGVYVMVATWDDPDSQRNAGAREEAKPLLAALTALATTGPDLYDVIEEAGPAEPEPAE